MSVHVCVCVLLLVAQSCLTPCDPMDCSPPGPAGHGILQAGILEGVACPPPGDRPDPGIEPESLTSPASAGGIFTTSATRKPFVYTSVCIRVCVCVCASVHTRMCVCKYACTYVCVHKYVCVYVYACVSVCVYVCLCV